MEENSMYADLDIDEYNLLDECKHQPSLYMTYAEESVDAQEEADNVKDRLDVMKASIEMQIRQGTYPGIPEKFKATEGAIASLVMCDKELIELKREYVEAKKNAVLMKKIEIAFDHRKKSLDNIVTLTGREQYADIRENNTNASKTKNKLDEKMKKLMENK